MTTPGPRASDGPRSAEASPLLVATDLDGTLLRRDGTVSAWTRDVLAAVEAAGVTVVFVTARPPRFLEAVAGSVGEHGLVLCANGAFVVEVATRRVLESHVLDPALVLELARDLRAAVPGVRFAVETAASGGVEPEFAEDRLLPVTVPPAPLEDLVERAPVGKLLARTPDLSPDKFHPLLAEVVDGRAEVAYSGAVGLGEVTASGVTKAAVLARWCAEHEVPASRVWAFGDMPNDLSMLRWAGTAHAVANAHPDVRAAADLVVGHHDEDGVAEVLATLLPVAPSR